MRGRYSRHISIHAPPRGATETGYGKLRQLTFQFTPLREGRRLRGNGAETILLFQFTPLREGRRVACCECCSVLNFNSRPSARGDRCRSRSPTSEKFQFTPLREGRRYRAWMGKEALEISIHAPPRGATRDAFGYSPILTHFNSRPSARGDSFRFFPVRRKPYFNSRPSARGDFDFPNIGTIRFIFQFTPLREGRRDIVLSDVLRE